MYIEFSVTTLDALYMNLLYMSLPICYVYLSLNSSTANPFPVQRKELLSKGKLASLPKITETLTLRNQEPTA